jgi:rhamnogalacturonyl hydrolase YesR
LTNLEEPTMRPKISPAQALANVKRQTKNQFDHAKQKHDQAWKKYSAIPAPMFSRRHDQVSKEMLFWQERMEEFRLALDNLRDVEEGMADDGDV